MLGLCFQALLSVIFSVCFHLLVLFLCILCSVLKTVFHIINSVFGLWILPLITLMYLLVLQWYYFCCQFLSSTASFSFISFWCFITLSLISSFILSVVLYNILLCLVHFSFLPWNFPHGVDLSFLFCTDWMIRRLCWDDLAEKSFSGTQDDSWRLPSSRKRLDKLSSPQNPMDMEPGLSLQS